MPYEPEPIASNFYLGPETAWNEVKWLFADVAEVGVYQNFTHCTDANIPTDNPPAGITRMYAKQDGAMYYRVHDGAETPVGAGISGYSGFSGALGNPYSPIQSVSGYSGLSVEYINSTCRTFYTPAQVASYIVYLPTATGSGRAINFVAAYGITGTIQLRPTGTDVLACAFSSTTTSQAGPNIINIGFVIDAEAGKWIYSPRN